MIGNRIHGAIFLLPALLLLGIIVPGASAAAAENCVLENKDKELVPFDVAKILQCVKNGEAVDLSRVRVLPSREITALDFGLLPSNSDLALLAKDGKIQRRLATEPDLATIERTVGRKIRAVRLVGEKISIRKSVVEVAVKAPGTRKDSTEAFAPVVFAKFVDFSETSFRSDFELPLAQFMADFSLEGGEFAAGFDNEKSAPGRYGLQESAFYGEANFRCLRTTRRLAGPPKRLLLQDVNLRAAVFLGRTRFECNAPLEAGALNLTESRMTGPSVRFDELHFHGTFDLSLARIAPKVYLPRTTFKAHATFNSSIFEGGIAANGAVFSSGGDFARATFGAASAASFDGVTFAANTDFRGARFASAADFSGIKAEAGALNFRDTVFEGEARFHGSQISSSNFENARFNKTASFALAVIGAGKKCLTDGFEAVSFDRAAFDGRVDFVSAKIAAPINLSHTNFKSGELMVRWDQLKSMINLDLLEWRPDKGCKGEWSFRQVQPATVTLQEEFYRRLEDNFRKQSQLEDATAAFYLKEEAATEGAGHSDGLRYWRGRISEFVWGYGVRPAFVLRNWALTICLFGLLYWVSGTPISLREEPFGLPTLGLTTLPIMPALEPWPPAESGQAHGAPKAWCEVLARAIPAFQASFVAGTGIRVGSAVFALEPRSRMRFFVITERMLGHVWLALFVISLGQSVPIVGEILSFILK